ncbi:MAG TPA: hypothetical protein VK988_19015 [Acidimicrobiales bacterium]|nr:hypothetical protein [Acidimicrobiales bacterium]
MTVESFAGHLLTLDAYAHHYGRTVPREQRIDPEYSAEGAYLQLSVSVHMYLVQHLANPEFETAAHELIKKAVRLSIRHHRRRWTEVPRRPRPPIPTVALALFVEQHKQPGDAAPCFPWWWPVDRPLLEDQVPDLPPHLGQ